MAKARAAGLRNLIHRPDGDLVFTPSPRLRAFYLFLLILAVWIGILPWFLLAAVTLPGHLILTLVLPLLVLILGIRWWIPKYWASLQFQFSGTDLVCERGVWWKTRYSVAYTWIRDIEIECGMVCRYLGIAKLRVVLDDGRIIRLPGVEEPVEVRELLWDLIQKKSPPGD